jgi:hypothetical protein
MILPLPLIQQNENGAYDRIDVELEMIDLEIDEISQTFAVWMVSAARAHSDD